jgi:Family of unknown function (DUF5519)
MDSAFDRIRREVSSWVGVAVAPHRFGGIEFRVGRRELGHLHGSRLADLPFPMRIRNELIASGRAQPHHVLPDTGWISYYMRGADDADGAIDLFRLNYERPWLSQRRNDSLDEASEDAFPG